MIHTLFTFRTLISIFTFKTKARLYVTSTVVTRNWARLGAVFAEMVRSRTTYNHKDMYNIAISVLFEQAIQHRFTSNGSCIILFQNI